MMAWRALAVRALREPLFQFLIAGAVIFLVFAWRGTPVDAGDRKIVISEAQVRQIVLRWSEAWQRPPTPTELDGLIRDQIKEEIYYREALRLGLDRDDAIVRRRLRAKMEEIAGATVENEVASDATLQAFLDRNPARYAPDPLLSFDQLYLGMSSDDAVALPLLARLNRGDAPDGLGEALSIAQHFEATPRSEIIRLFGDDFAAKLATLAPGAWLGPVTSGYGAHLVRLRALRAPVKHSLADVRQAVENDWRSSTGKSREARAYQALLDGYEIEIERPR